MGTFKIKRLFVDEEKLFSSDSSVASELEGKLNQALLHILKLMYKFDYSRDEESHKDAVAAHLEKALIWLFDKKSKGVDAFLGYYRTLVEKHNFIEKATDFFRKIYSFGKNTVTDSDIDLAFEHMKNIMIGSKNKSDIRNKLNKEL